MGTAFDTEEFERTKLRQHGRIHGRAWARLAEPASVAAVREEGVEAFDRHPGLSRCVLVLWNQGLDLVGAGLECPVADPDYRSGFLAGAAEAAGR